MTRFSAPPPSRSADSPSADLPDLAVLSQALATSEQRGLRNLALFEPEPSVPILPPLIIRRNALQAARATQAALCDQLRSNAERFFDRELQVPADYQKALATLHAFDVATGSQPPEVQARLKEVRPHFENAVNLSRQALVDESSARVSIDQGPEDTSIPGEVVAALQSARETLISSVSSPREATDALLGALAQFEHSVGLIRGAELARIEELRTNSSGFMRELSRELRVKTSAAGPEGQRAENQRNLLKSPTGRLLSAIWEQSAPNEAPPSDQIDRLPAPQKQGNPLAALIDDLGFEGIQRALTTLKHWHVAHQLSALRNKAVELSVSSEASRMNQEEPTEENWLNGEILRISSLALADQLSEISRLAYVYRISEPIVTRQSLQSAGFWIDTSREQFNRQVNDLSLPEKITAVIASEGSPEQVAQLHTLFIANPEFALFI